MTRATDGVRQVETARPVDVEEMATVAHHVLADAEASHMAMAVAEAIAKHLATPVPEIAAGTAGTATITWVVPPRKGVRVMRVADTYSWVDDRGNRYTDDSVTDFVPDETTVRGHDARHWSGEAIRLEGRAEHWERVFRSAQDEIARVRQVANEEAGMKDEVRAEVEKYKQAARKYQDEHAKECAEVERLRKSRNFANQRALTAEAVANRLRETPCPGTHCGEEAVCPAAPEPRPTFVLPDREAVARLLFASRWPDLNWDGTGGHRQSAERDADAVLALWAEHAVTEERLAEAWDHVMSRGGDLRTVTVARKALAHLTGKAPS